MKRSKYSNFKPKPNVNPTSTVKSQFCYTLGIDLNTNSGQGYGPFRLPGELDLLPYVSSVNVACGMHAGDPVLIETCIEEVKQYGLSLGALIGLPDKLNLGNREINLPISEIRSYILFQLGSLYSLAKASNIEITQVRPVGYLYRQMTQDLRIATAIAKAVSEFDKWLILIGPCGDNLATAGERADIRVAGEVILDRVYDSSLNPLPDSHPKAKIKSTTEIISQANHLLSKSEIKVVEGGYLPINFQTIHLSSQLPDAVEIADHLRQAIPNISGLAFEPYEIDIYDKMPSYLYDVN